MTETSAGPAAPDGRRGRQGGASGRLGPGRRHHQPGNDPGLLPGNGWSSPRANPACCRCCTCRKRVSADRHQPVFAAEKQDGDRLEPGNVVARINGPARALLSAERVALNFLGHLSGIATATALFADLIAHTKASIVCTRKTTPGLRGLRKIRGEMRRRVQPPLRSR
jgi:hypothetical protein